MRDTYLRFLDAPFGTVLYWDSSRANFLSKAGQNSNIYKGFLLKARQNSNSQTGNHTPPQEHAHTSIGTPQE